MKSYAWEGQTVRVSHKDYASWKKNYHAIPDFDATLFLIDTWMQGQPEEKKAKWFWTASAWLHKEHQEHMKDQIVKKNTNAGGWI